LEKVNWDNYQQSILAEQGEPGELKLLYGDPLAQLPAQILGKVRTRPTDLTCFTRQLDELEELLQPPGVHRDKEDREYVREAIALVRSDLQANAKDMRISVAGLRGCVKLIQERALYNEKKLELDKLLKDLIDARHRFEQEIPYVWMFERWDPLFMQEGVEKAKTYLEARWMHTPFLTNYMLTNLLDASFGPLLHKHRLARDHPLRVKVGVLLPLLLLYLVWHIGKPPWYGTLALVSVGGFWVWACVRMALEQRIANRLELLRAEVSSGLYDGKEVVRRLRQLEGDGFHVPSLTYALLRLSKSRCSREG
jgi:hypothetical protein